MKIVSQLFLPIGPGLTNLQRIAAVRVMGATFINELTNEISFERLALEMTNCNFHSVNAIMLSVLVIYLYSRITYYDGIRSKLQQTDLYDRYNRIFRDIMFIVFLVFTRDVQNAI